MEHELDKVTDEINKCLSDLEDILATARHAQNQYGWPYEYDQDYWEMMVTECKALYKRLENI